MLLSCVCWNIPFANSKDCTFHPDIIWLKLQNLGWNIHHLHIVAVQTPKRTSQAKANQWSEWRSREPQALQQQNFQNKSRNNDNYTQQKCCKTHIKHAMHSSISKYLSVHCLILSYLILSSHRLCMQRVLAVLYCQILSMSLWLFRRKWTCTHSDSDSWSYYGHLAENATKRQPA